MSTLEMKGPRVATLLLLLAFAVRVFGLGDRSLWYDEGYTVMFARHDFSYLFTQAARLEINTPLHYILLHVWMIGTGMSEFATRFLSVCADIITVSLIYRLVRMALSQRAALWCAAIVALWPVNISLAQETRMYALAICLSVLSLTLLVVCLTSHFERRLPLVLWCISSVAAFSAHVLTVFVIASQSIIILSWWLFRSPKPRARIVPGVVVATGLVLAGWLIYLLTQAGFYGTTYNARLDFSITLWQSFAATGLPRLLPAEWATVAALMMGAIVMLAVVFTRGNARSVPVCAIASLAGIAAFCSITGKFAGRYPAIVAPFVAASFGMVFDALDIYLRGILRVRARVLRMALPLVSCGLCVAFLVAWRVMPVYANDDFRGAAQYIRANITGDETVLLVSGHMAPVFEYYYGAIGWHALPDDPVLNIYHALDYDSAVPVLNRVLAGKEGAWLLLWQNDLVDPTAITQSLLRRQSVGLSRQLDTDQYYGLRLQRYRFFQPYQVLPDLVPDMISDVQQTDRQRGLSASGCIQFVLPRAGDGFLEVACFWYVATGTSMPVATQVSLRLNNAKGEQILQSDQVIAPNGLPYTPYGKPIASFYTIHLPPDFPAGDYSLRVIPYTADEQISPQVVLPIQVLPK